MTLFMYLSLILVSNLVLWFISVKKDFDVCAYYILGQLFLFVPAPFLISMGLQADHNNAFLETINFDDALSLQGVIFALHLCGILMGYVVFTGKILGRSILPHFNENRSDFMTFTGLALLTLINAAVIAVPLLKSGSFFGAIHLIRNEFYFSGMNYLRIFLVVGTFLSAAHFAHILRHRKAGSYGGYAIVFVGALFLANLGFSSVLGGKGFIVYPFIFFILALNAHQLHRRLGMIAMIGMVFIGLVVTLQQIRVEMVHDNQRYGLWDYAYVGLRFQLFEDNMVYLGSDGDLHNTETGEDFINGFMGPIPRSIWKDKPSEITAGARFKRQLMPSSDGGWPPYGMNQWYVNFGWLGIILGGALTGIMLKALQTTFSDYRTNAYSFVIMMVFLVRLLVNGGVNNMFLIEYIFYILPLFIFAKLTNKGFYRSRDSAVRTSV